MASHSPVPHTQPHTHTHSSFQCENKRHTKINNTAPDTSSSLSSLYTRTDSLVVVVVFRWWCHWLEFIQFSSSSSFSILVGFTFEFFFFFKFNWTIREICRVCTALLYILFLYKKKRERKVEILECCAYLTTIFIFVIKWWYQLLPSSVIMSNRKFHNRRKTGQIVSPFFTERITFVLFFLFLKKI
jgi:hypothetical protein